MNNNQRRYINLKELITLMKYEKGKSKTIGYSLDESTIKEYISTRKLEIPMFIKKHKIDNKTYQLLLELFPEKELQKYYSLVLFSGEKYLVNRLIEEQLSEFHDLECLSVYSQGDNKYDRYKKDILMKNVYRHKQDRINSLIKHHVFDTLLEGCENISDISNEIEEMDNEFKNIINI